ncbi:MAG: RdgB/HAM1 family non-canonical purine NTP pyrophosphatase [Candidatus Promineifilaceae bacterium]
MGRYLLLATHNTGKKVELADLLGDLGVDLKTPADLDLDMVVAEVGRTFEENAVLKATEYARATGYLTLADDSGLEVDALNGQPGVHTARYGGEGLTPRQRYERLLQVLAGVPWDKRTARFRCVVALADADGLLGTASGKCEGLISYAPAGEQGFGYDPVFFLPERGLTMAQLTAEEKQQISHRGRAIMAIKPLLRELLAG